MNPQIPPIKKPDDFKNKKAILYWPILGVVVLVFGGMIWWSWSMTSKIDDVKPIEIPKVKHISEEAKIHNEKGLEYYNEAKFKLEAKRKFDEATIKYEEAATEFRKAIEIEPNYIEAHKNLARVYLFQKNMQKKLKNTR